MTLIVEDGSIVDNAESYISVQDADDYHTSRGMGNWLLLTTDQKEQALRRATDYMLARYRGRWKGAKARYTQPLDWPRVGVNPDDNAEAVRGFGYYIYVLPYNTVPKEVKHVCAEFALRAAAGPLLDDSTQNVLQETVGPITTKYDPNSPQQTRYTQLDLILSPFLTAAGNPSMARLGRR